MPVRLVAVALLALGCRSDDPPRTAPVPAPPVADPVREAARLPPDPYLPARLAMVEDTIEARGITDRHVLTAMRLTPRHEFVPPALRSRAYDDRPLPIGFALTISQPYIVAVMSQAARIQPGDRVLEIGTGSGYQAAVLAMMGADVYTIELHEQLGARTAAVLERTGFKRVKMRIGDGWFGWPDAAPFDAILVTCATPIVPDRLLAQLAVGGRLVAPIGEGEQILEVMERTANGYKREALMAVQFGPMRGVIDAER